MSQNNLKLLLGNPAGFSALLDFLKAQLADAELALNKAARSALFKVEDRDYALTIQGKIIVYNELVRTLNALEHKTSTEEN